MKILVCYPNIRNIYTGSNVYYFLEELGRQADCRFVGYGYPDSNLKVKPGTQEQYFDISKDIWAEVINEVKRLAPVEIFQMAPAQVERYKTLRLYDIKKHYGNEDPDWVLGSMVSSQKINRNYKLCRWVGDTHVTADLQIKLSNEELDALALRCLHSSYLFPTVADFRACFGKTLKVWLESGHCLKLPEDWYVKQLKTKAIFWPPSVEPSYFKPIDESEKKYDVTMIGTVGNIYPLRQKIDQGLPQLAKENNWNMLLRRPPSTNKINRPYRVDIQKILDKPELRKKWLLGEDYVKALAESKVFIFGTSVFRYPSPKFFEAMGSGACVLADRPFHMEDMHFEPDWNFVEINPENWKEKLEHILDDDQLRETIARRGYETMMKYHTNEVRVKEFIEELKTVA